MIIVGDTGQGDIAAAKTSLSQFRQMQRNIPHVFMHDVVSYHESLNKIVALLYTGVLSSQVTDKASQARLYDNNQRRSLALEGIFLFDSYVDAGLLALQVSSWMRSVTFFAARVLDKTYVSQHGLISPAQACSIQQCTYEELLAICSCDEPNRYGK